MFIEILIISFIILVFQIYIAMLLATRCSKLTIIIIKVIYFSLFLSSFLFKNAFAGGVLPNEITLIKFFELHNLHNFFFLKSMFNYMVFPLSSIKDVRIKSFS